VRGARDALPSPEPAETTPVTTPRTQSNTYTLGGTGLNLSAGGFNYFGVVGTFRIRYGFYPRKDAMKFISEEDIEQGLEAVEQVENYLDDKTNLIFQARARIFSRIPEPTHLRKGENYQVDLHKAWFEHFYDERILTFGPLQIVGTFLPYEVSPNSEEAIEFLDYEAPAEGTFLWAWHDPGIPEIACRQTRQFIENHPPFSDLVQGKGFECNDAFASRLADYVSVETGFLGSYPAPFEKATTMLALKLSVGDKDHFTWGENDNFWCINCGWSRLEKKTLLKGKWGAICDECALLMVNDLREIERERLESDEESPLPILDIHCFICDGSKNVVMLPYTAICPACMEKAITLLTVR
jgi:hypothetical protein